MEKELLKINIMSIAGAGLLMLLTGLLMYALRSSVAPYLRYFLPIPPLGVAAYMLVFHVFKHYDGKLPEGNWAPLTDVLWGTAVAAVVFFIFSLLLLVGIKQLQRYV